VAAVQEFDEVDALLKALKSIIREGDVVLVKGSHGLHMERIVQALEVNA
jgi:UDP-N-acetylmuramoyl-tripeptide--D-alanyl-D-alanine ligase